MKKCFVLLVLVAQSFSLPAQDMPKQNVDALIALVDGGKADDVIQQMMPIAQSTSRSPSERGRAWTLIGFALKEDNKFAPAQRAYEQALQLFNEAGVRDQDYAAALDYFAALYMAVGDPASARPMLLESIDIEKTTQKHLDLAGMYTDLAGVSIAQRKYRDAATELKLATAEAQLGSAKNKKLQLDIDSTSGWLASATGRTGEAVADYTRGLETCRQEYGETHPFTGWSYLLVGNAKAVNGDLKGALTSMQVGLNLLKNTVGANNVRYLTGEIAYSKLLDQSGSHTEAERVRLDAEQSLRAVYGGQCFNCSVSVSSLRAK